MTDAECRYDIEQKLRCWDCLSHFRDAESNVAWLLDHLAERDARIEKLEARLRRRGWMFSLPRAQSVDS